MILQFSNFALRTLTGFILLLVIFYTITLSGFFFNFFIFCLLNICCYEYYRMSRGSGIFGYIYIVMGIFGFCMVYMIKGSDYTLLIILLTWSNDTCAYIIGNLFGKSLMIPTVSFQKTWEGFVGGVLGTGMFAFLSRNFFPEISTFDMYYICLICMFAPVGDLIESKLKRFYNQKNSSNLLPGHGGFLDRFDSLFFTMPCCFMYFMFFSK